MHAQKRTLYLVLLTLALLLIAAVPAWAANSITPATSAIGKTETYTVTLDTFSPDLPISDLMDKNVTLKFPSGFDVSGLAGKTLDVSVTDSQSTPQTDYMQPVASVSGQNVTVNLPAAAFKSTSGTSNVGTIIFKGVTVKNPGTAGTYTVELWLAGDTSKRADVSVTVSADFPKTVNITALSPTTVKIGSTFNIEVEVKNLVDQPLAGQSVSLSMPGAVFSPSTLSPTNALGKTSETVTIDTSTKPGTYQVVATAGGVSSAAQTITVTAGDPDKIEFVDENNKPITTPVSGTVGQRQALRVALFDSQNNLTAAASDVVVVLSARDGSNNLAGRFYSASTGGSEIDRVTIAKDQPSATFWYAPALPGNATVKATAQGVTWSVPDDEITVSATPVGGIDGVATSHTSIYVSSAKVGYPFKVTVTLRSGSQTAIADKDYTVRIDFGSGDVGTWDTSFSPSLRGAKKSGDTFVIQAGQSNRTIYVYPERLDGAGNNAFDIQVTVGSLTPITETCPLGAVSDNTKTFSQPGWVVVSTPVELAGNGDFKTLFGLTDQNVNDYIASILTYENGTWANVSSTTKLEPLKAYFVKLKQQIDATYFWKLHTSPQAPAQRSLVAGWNLVGVSAPIGTGTTAGALDGTVAADEVQFFRPVFNVLLAAVNAEDGSVFDPNAAPPPSVQNGGAYWVSLSGPATIYSLAVPPYVAE